MARDNRLSHGVRHGPLHARAGLRIAWAAWERSEHASGCCREHTIASKRSVDHVGSVRGRGIAIKIGSIVVKISRPEMQESAESCGRCMDRACKSVIRLLAPSDRCPSFELLFGFPAPTFLEIALHWVVNGLLRRWSRISFDDLVACSLQIPVKSAHFTSMNLRLPLPWSAMFRGIIKLM